MCDILQKLFMTFRSKPNAINDAISCAFTLEDMNGKMMKPVWCSSTWHVRDFECGSHSLSMSYLDGKIQTVRVYTNRKLVAELFVYDHTARIKDDHEDVIIHKLFTGICPSWKKQTNTNTNIINVRPQHHHNQLYCCKANELIDEPDDFMKRQLIYNNNK